MINPRVSFLRILIFLGAAFSMLLSCNSEKKESDALLDSKIDTVKVTTETQDVINNPEPIKDTDQLIKNNIFVAEFFLTESKYNNQLFRKILIFDTSNLVSYKFLNATNHMLTGREFDGREKSSWKRVNDLLTVNWVGYYGARFSSRNFKRNIISKYKIQINGNSEVDLLQISDSVITAEVDPDAQDIGSSLPPFENGFDRRKEIKFIKVLANELNSKYLTANYQPIDGPEKEASKQYNQQYKIDHSCNSQASFDAGYSAAREQLGAGLLADEDYLYETFGSGYNYYCFSRGVKQWIKDNK